MTTQREEQCLFSWNGKNKFGITIVHNCKLKKRHRGKHKCKYRGYDLDVCMVSKERV